MSQSAFFPVISSVQLYSNRSRVRVKSLGIEASVKVDFCLFLLAIYRWLLFPSDINECESNDGEGYESVTKKVNSRRFKSYLAYSISFTSSHFGKCFWSWILKDCIKVQEKKKKVFVLCSRPRQNVNLGTCTLWSCSDGKEMYKKAWCTCRVVVLPT